MLRRDFQPSQPAVTSEEMQHVLDFYLANTGSEPPQDVYDIMVRDDQNRREFSAYMREATHEIVEKMLPPSEPLTLRCLMDMLHVYFWWHNHAAEPLECIEDLLQDLNDTRFTEATKVLHDAFRDECMSHYYDSESGSQYCESVSGMDCLQRYQELTGGTPIDELLGSPSSRAHALIMLLGDALNDLEDDDDEPDWDDLDMFEYLRSSNSVTNSRLYSLLGQHAVARLTDAGLSDLEAMEATYVLDQEKQMRAGQGMNHQKYSEHRQNGGDLESYLRSVVIKLLKKPDELAEAMRDYGYYGINSADLTSIQYEDIVVRYIAEIRERGEYLEAMYQLQNEGISPYFRRRMAEENFPADQRS